MTKITINEEYKNWLSEIKTKIKTSQIKAALSVNSELIMLYWEIGKMISEKQKQAKWGDSFIVQTAKDIKREFPDLTGFSKTNLYSMKQFYLFYNKDNTIFHQVGGKIETEIFHQVGGQFQQTENEDNTLNSENILTKIPWKHHVLILQKVKEIQEAIFYVKETISNNWSRSVLEYQIETDLYNRQGKAITNFKITLPETESDLANSILKDPYNFDFLTLTKKEKEKELETKLIEHISQFLLELGKGFAYMGRQFLLKVGKKEFRTDLLFYHVKLRSYIVIELKMTEFEPEFIGKLGFYVTAVNEILKSEHDNPTIGILLCKTKDNLVVDFALKDVNKPIGVSEYSYKELPENIKNQLPTKEELEQEFLKKY